MALLFILLIGLAALFSLVQAIRIKDKFSRIINVIMVIAVGVSLVPNPHIAIDGYYLYMIACLLVILYSFNDSSFDWIKRSILIVMGIIPLLATLFWLQKWPYTQEIWYLCIIPVLSYIFIITREIRSYQIEIGFLTVLMVDALIKTVIVFSSTESVIPTQG